MMRIIAILFPSFMISSRNSSPTYLYWIVCFYLSHPSAATHRYSATQNTLQRLHQLLKGHNPSKLELEASQVSTRSLRVPSSFSGKKLAKKSKLPFISSSGQCHGAVTSCRSLIGIWFLWGLCRGRKSEEKSIEHADDLAEAGPHVRVLDPAWLYDEGEIGGYILWKSRSLLLQLILKTLWSKKVQSSARPSIKTWRKWCDRIGRIVNVL